MFYEKLLMTAQEICPIGETDTKRKTDKSNNKGR